MQVSLTPQFFLENMQLYSKQYFNIEFKLYHWYRRNIVHPLKGNIKNIWISKTVNNIISTSEKRMIVLTNVSNLKRTLTLKNILNPLILFLKNLVNSSICSLFLLIHWVNAKSTQGNMNKVNILCNLVSNDFQCQRCYGK